MKNRKLRTNARLLAVLLSVIMIFTCIPVLPSWGENSAYVFADNEQDPSADVESDQAQEEEPESNTENTESAPNAEKTKDDSKAALAEGITTKRISDTSWYVGHESDSEFTLMSEEDMQGFADLVNNGNSFKGKTIKLGEDLIEVTTKPIGTKEKPFAGTFDGAKSTTENHDLTSLNLTVGEINKHIGLFGYATKDSTIKNLDIRGGTLKVTETKGATGQQIRYVGAVAGYTEGKIENCYSTMGVDISSKMTLGQNQGIIRNVGGLVGYTEGNIKDSIHNGTISISSSSDVNKDVRLLVGEIGGIAGAQGDVTEPMDVPITENCTNRGSIKFNLTGKGGQDRFGQQLYSIAFSTGGIIGQASGQVRNCTNSAIINTSNGTETKPEHGRGATNTGGIVGSLRSDTFEAVSTEETRNTNFSREDAAYAYYKDNGGAAAGSAALPKTAGIYDCTNTGVVNGLSAVGGIVGNGGSFSEIEGCANRGEITGCRWNKPFTAGIAGNTQGHIRYCYNRGNINSATGAGYFCAGIVGGLWVAHEPTTEDNHRVPTSEMTGCYTTGRIYTSSAGFKTGILAGENEGFIHDNVFLKGLTIDNKVVDDDSGSLVNNTELSANGSQLKASKGRGHLNVYAAGKGDWNNFYLPDAANANGGFPVLGKGNRSIDSAVNIPSSSKVVKINNASYSAVREPIPDIEITGLVQNADYYVTPQAGAKAVTSESEDKEPYVATITGMGSYKGQLSGTFKYGISKANINQCTIVAEASIYNWEVQRPNADSVKLIDAGGNEVAKSEYTAKDRYDKSKGTDGEKEESVMHYFDYTNSHGESYKYDVIVEATGSSNYQGSSTQAAYRIKFASMTAQRPKTDPKYNPDTPESVVYGDITWKGKKWPLLEAIDDKYADGSYIKIPYTGGVIKPTVTSVTYLGKEMRKAIDYDYQEHPLKYDYKYVYGNPNPEVATSPSKESVNVTPKGEPSCMTVRFTNGGNFHSYINAFFQIVPADIGPAKATVSTVQYSGKLLKPKPAITWNGKKLKEGKDYSLTGITYSSNKSIGKGTIKFTIKGKGNFNGSHKKTATFKINPRTTKISKLTSGKKSLKVAFAKVSSAQKVTKYEIRYRQKGTSKWKVKAVKASAKSLTIKSLKRGKYYQVGVRAVKAIKSGSSKGTYYGSWSSTKTSKKIK